MTAIRHFHCELTAGNGESVVLAASAANTAGLEILSSILHIPVQKKEISCVPEVVISSGNKQENMRHFAGLRGMFQVALHPEEVAFYFYDLKDIQPFEFGRWLLAAGVLAAALRGKRIMMMHGALLETSPGHGIILGADSGTGKSTTSKRWSRCGKKSVADDMLLVAWDDQFVYAHGLPTWSRLNAGESVCDLHYPFVPGLIVDTVLDLRREKEKEEVKMISGAEFFARICRSSYYFLQNLIRNFTAEEKERVNRSFAAGINRIVDDFPPRALYARLEDDLSQTIGGITRAV